MLSVTLTRRPVSTFTPAPAVPALERSPRKNMHLDQRLDLIVEAVKYCQKVKSMGMPASCYTKALREPVFFLWELRHTKKKIKAAQFRSSASIGVEVGGGSLIYDHAIPFIYLQRELLGCEVVTRDTVQSILVRYGTACLITKDEDNELNKLKLGRAMPEGWDMLDPLARYRVLGIDIVPNPHHSQIGRGEQDAALRVQA